MHPLYAICLLSVLIAPLRASTQEVKAEAASSEALLYAHMQNAKDSPTRLKVQERLAKLTEEMDKQLASYHLLLADLEAKDSKAAAALQETMARLLQAKQNTFSTVEKLEQQNSYWQRIEFLLKEMAIQEKQYQRKDL